MSNLPEPLRRRDVVLHPSLLKAAVSPTAVAATAVGAGIGALDQSIALAVVLAVVGWGGRMVAAVIAKARRERAARPRPAQLDPWSVPEPWRQLLQQAGAAQLRFDQTVDDWPEGPIQERLIALRPRFYAEMDLVGAMARRGAALTGWTGAAGMSNRPSANALAGELLRAEAERARLGGRSPGREAQLARAEEAVAAQLRALRSSEDAAAVVHDRLRVAVARLDETITTVLVLGAEVGSLGHVEGVVDALQDLNDEMTALHTGLSQAAGTPPDSFTP
ncbi:MAG: hypothetical protein JO337_02100 [Acidimicrobiales bacterium]|nr:hypothetical protein [Acidimicrobiales bacterium]